MKPLLTAFPFVRYSCCSIWLLLIVTLGSTGCTTQSSLPTVVDWGDRKSVYILVRDAATTQHKSSDTVKAAAISGLSQQLIEAGLTVIDSRTLDLDDWPLNETQVKTIVVKNRPAPDFVATITLEVQKQRLPYVQKVRAKQYASLIHIKNGEPLGNAKVEDSTTHLQPDCLQDCTDAKIADVQHTLSSHIGSLLTEQLTNYQQTQTHSPTYSPTHTQRGRRYAW